MLLLLFKVSVTLTALVYQGQLDQQQILPADWTD